MAVIDLHVHTNYGSEDSTIEPRELVQIARKMGLDGICIAEHGNRKSEIAKELAQEFNFPVLAGIEASTDLGDILVFGIESYPRTMYRAVELRRFVAEDGGAMIAAHPFRNDITQRLVRGAERGLTLEQACQRQLLHLVDAMEIANGWCKEEDVDFCRRVSARLGLKGTGGSDAHVPWQIGCCVTVFEKSIRTESELVVELRRGRFRAEDRRTKEQKNPLYWFS